jgi:hypothetical protein
MAERAVDAKLKLAKLRRLRIPRQRIRILASECARYSEQQNQRNQYACRNQPQGRGFIVEHFYNHPISFTKSGSGSLGIIQNQKLVGVRLSEMAFMRRCFSPVI